MSDIETKTSAYYEYIYLPPTYLSEGERGLKIKLGRACSGIDRV